MANELQLFVADTENNRVLVYEPFPTTNQPAATTVIGQSDFQHHSHNDDDQDDAPDPAGPTARTLFSPQGVIVVGNRVIVSEYDNNRVLLFDGM